jgi:glycogen synthase kinase 3 beta
MTTNNTWNFSKEKLIATGTFAQVMQSTIADSGEVVAVKKQKQNKKFKNRELAIMKEMDHPNVIKLLHAFFTSGDRPEDSILNIVMDFIPMTVFRINFQFQKLNQPVHPILLKLYSYQLLRGLAYIHGEGVMHRDIKP